MRHVIWNLWTKQSDKGFFNDDIVNSGISPKTNKRIIEENINNG